MERSFGHNVKNAGEKYFFTGRYVHGYDQNQLISLIFFDKRFTQL